MKRLYLRIWLTVVLTVCILTLIVGWTWQMTEEAPPREVVVSDEEGNILGNGLAYAGPRSHNPNEHHLPPPPPFFALRLGDKPNFSLAGRSPEFELMMENGEIVFLHMPRTTDNIHNPLGFFWTLVLVGIAVAMGAYPAIRRLTRRLEHLHKGVERWGRGDLSSRVDIKGKDEVAFLAQSFNRAAEQVQSLVNSRENLLASQKALLANASHELRSPLARIRIGLELMGSTPTLHTRNEIARNIAELDALIEEILLASRLDTHETDLGPLEDVDLVGLSAEECARTQALLDVQTTEILVPGVSKLLRRVIRNLLENARRYGGNDVCLLLRTHEQEAVLQVHDSGPGVPEDKQERIFEPFYRLPGASEREGGVGLGLALVKSIVTRHGGSVSCRNRSLGGACFEVRLPLRSCAPLVSVDSE
ncbi:HAMP domain-containing protein [Curvibacter sp. CHRR-16]|uniref:ATP-binding protein n=1 Tax=Curvibacter sp. CHRR-16 TaxID=2835872 RepID=UPI001BDA673E|nr:ATP-binding protein [Curvibacter sp. CHRR-16]MBT0570078.1 HAMP domain-containing protein [Curvibacter sp. CHRR-16]